MSLGSRYWSGRFSRWTEALPAEHGYSLLIPVPGDLPVFLELALTVARLQNLTHCVETIVLPDRPTRQIKAVLESYQPTWPGRLHIRWLPMPERIGLPILREPGHNHAIQLITGVQAARGDHVVLHDADLFFLHRRALADHYEATVRDDLNVCGVDPVWDKWFAERGMSLAATWELCARREWLRSFPPHLHMAHEGEIMGERHVFDTTLHPQALSDPRKVGVREQPEGIVHFNYVISTYRHYQRSRRRKFEDRNFRILLIRIFVDLFANHPYDYRLPSLADLQVGLRHAHAPVSYPEATAESADRYRAYRLKLTKILGGEWVARDRAEGAAEALLCFDRHYGVQV